MKRFIKRPDDRAEPLILLPVRKGIIRHLKEQGFINLINPGGLELSPALLKQIYQEG